MYESRITATLQNQNLILILLHFNSNSIEMIVEIVVMIVNIHHVFN